MNLNDAADDIAPEHDPLSEEMDLITFQEADARLYEELKRTVALVERLRSAEPADTAEIQAQQGRIEALRRVAARLQAQRTQPPIS